MILMGIVLMANVCYAEVYYVEVDVVTKKDISCASAIELPVDTAISIFKEITKEWYDKMNPDSKEFDKWLAIQVNSDEVDLAIATKPKTDKERLAELEAKITVLESKP